MINEKSDIDNEDDDDDDIFDIQEFPQEMAVYQEKECVDNKVSDNDKETHSTQTLPETDQQPHSEPAVQQLSLQQLFQCVFNLSTKQTPPELADINHNDLQTLSYSYLKHFSKLRINKDESFMIRMLFDTMKRQSQEKNLSLFLKQTKAKMKEEERVKGFNRLIQDANRRLETQEKINELKQKIDNQYSIKGKPNKRYKSQQWKDIYDKRFKKYQEDKEEKIRKKISERKEMEKLKEEEEVKMCKRIKAPRKITELYGKRLYGEGMKGKDGNGNVKGKGRNMKKDAVIKKEKAHKTVSKNEAGNICNCGNSKGKGNKKVNSFVVGLTKKSDI